MRTSALLLSIVVFLVKRTDSACSNPSYTQVDGADCFKVYTTIHSYADAEAQCVQDGGHLASLHSANEDAIIAGMLTSGQYALIGLKCTSAQICSWSDTTPYDYNAFVGGTAVLQYGQCATLAAASKQWISTDCSTLMSSFICRIKNNQPTQGCGTYTAYDGACVTVKTTARSQVDAESDCIADGGHLVSIHSAQDNAYIEQLAYTTGIGGSFYIGLEVQGCCAGQWTDSSVFNYANWANLFPNDRYGQCVQLLINSDLGTAGQWTNVPCTEKLKYACRRPVGTSPTSAPNTCPNLQMFEDSGTIYSPGYPISFPAKIKCEYLLSVNYGSSVTVRFPRFETDTGSSVSIYDGIVTNVPLATLSGFVSSTTQYNSTGNLMKLVFQAGASPSGVGFEAFFSSSTYIGSSTTRTTITPPSTISSSLNCPSQQYYTSTTTNTTLFSPNYPQRYPPMANCYYFIQSLSGRRVSITFGPTDTEQCCDVVTVYDGQTTADPVLGRVSGAHPGGVYTFTSTYDHMTLNFVSDSNDEGTGWYAVVFDT